MSDEYLLATGPGSKKLWPLKDKLRTLGGFYTGFGWAFPSENETSLSELIRSIPNIIIYRAPLATGQSFEGHRHTYKAQYFRGNLAKLESSIAEINKSIRLKDFSEDVIQSADIDHEVKENLLSILREKAWLKEEINYAEGLAKALNSQKSQIFSIKPIIANDTNYLIDEEPLMPRLVNFIDGGQPKPFIRKGIVGQLVGSGGVGKTHALAQLALSLVMGTNWFGIYPIEKAGYVFMGLGENKDDDIHRLLRKIVRSQNNRSDNTFFDKNPLVEASKRLYVMSFSGMNGTFIHDGRSTQFFDMFLQELKDKEPEEGWACIILDPISRFMGADAESDNAAATQFIALLERLTLELKGQPTVLFGHHMNKSGLSSTSTDQGAARGSSAITDGVRWQANLEKVKKDPKKEDGDFELNKITLRSVKSNFTVVLPPQELLKNEHGCFSAVTTEQNQPVKEKEKPAKNHDPRFKHKDGK